MSLESRIDSFEKAFRTFEEFSQADLTQNMAKAAFVKAFEYNYELAWKTMKAYAERKGLVAPSPRDAMRSALQLGLIEDESLWLSVQKDRNTTAHTYSTDYLPEMIGRMKQSYVAEFARLLRKISEDLSKGLV